MLKLGTDRFTRLVDQILFFTNELSLLTPVDADVRVSTEERARSSRGNRR